MVPNLFPGGSWAGMRVETVSTAGGVVISLYRDPERDGTWEKVLEARDDGSRGESAITSEGYAGIRSDFMDVEFDDLRIETL